MMQRLKVHIDDLLAVVPLCGIWNRLFVFRREFGFNKGSRERASGGKSGLGNVNPANNPELT